jgi:hypothetical protein
LLRINLIEFSPKATAEWMRIVFQY